MPLRVVQKDRRYIGMKTSPMINRKAECCSPRFPPVLHNLYSSGQTLQQLVLYLTRDTSFGQSLASSLISPADSSEYSEKLMTKTFAALHPLATPISDSVRSDQQSTQAEVRNYFNQAHAVCCTCRVGVDLN